ncbi:MAG: sigma-54-dependent Fis family transcriptional regulator [Ignavibacteriae bacterium]|nr:sigma-54-dependent Fis family transcriptional regulator [Ignavibacteriota bacterium]
MSPRSFQDEYGIIGESVEIKKIVEVVEQVAPTDITVLITGESGAGKEVIAKAIHGASNRSKKPLVTVNSGAIPEGIIESELFGHERGSFTGASEQRKGYFELADGGTIFLDEIGEMPLSAQVKFLRILENGEFLRVGSSVSRKVNVRVIAATNKDLESEVRHNRFRADLFFRLRSVNITIPPLRKRPEDIPIFFQRFVEEFSEKNNVPFAGISDEAMELLRSYHWPGNVRELRNVVESMLILEKGRYLDAADVRKYLKEYKPAPEDRHLPVHVGRSVEQAERELILRALLDIKGNLLDLRNLIIKQAELNAEQKERSDAVLVDSRKTPNLSLQEMEHRMIAEALQRFNGNRRVAARALNISERTLYRKIKEYGLE